VKVREYIPYLLHAKRKGHRGILRTDQLAVAASSWHPATLRREQLGDYLV
jgi:hypothetical protein